MADNSVNNQNILVEHDYENITVIDPNRVFQQDGTITERLVNHEELVKYANLEAIVIPRTKLVNGSNFDDNIENIRIGSMQGGERTNIDFLRGRIQQKEIVKSNEEDVENYFDTNYTDNFTSKFGKDSDDIDTQLLGITSIDIKISSTLIPQVKIEMSDVQGRVLFEQGEKSPYSAFMQQPYPLFLLTVKGFYGKAIRYELMLEKFNVRFDPSSGNYNVSTDFIARTFALLNDINLGYLYATPKMYHKRIETGPLRPNSQNTTSTTLNPKEFNIVKTTRGKDILKNVYSFYRSKGLIGDDFPSQQDEPITLEILIKKLERFEDYVMYSYGTEDMSVLVNIKNYRNTIEKYRTTFYGGEWFSKYLDNQPFISKGIGNPRVFHFKKELTYNDKIEALEELRILIEKYNNDLLSDKVFGTDGNYTIDGIKYESSIPVTVKETDIVKSFQNLNFIDFEKTYITNVGPSPTEEDIATYKIDITAEYTISDYIIDLETLEVDENQINSIFFILGDTFESATYSENSFLKKLTNINNTLEIKRKEIEEKLSNALSKKIKSNDIGLGFNPTINNVVAVISANADAFLRLMDEIHEEAWNKRKSKIRVNSVLGPNKENGIDSVDYLTESSLERPLSKENFVYPWPTYFEYEIDEDGDEKMVEKYPGDPSVINLTKGYRYDEWPEIECVEEYVKASLQKEVPSIDYRYNNEYELSKYTNFNAVEFPFYNTPYIQLDDISVYYEIVERSLLFFWMTKFDFNNSYKTTLVEFFSDLIVNNIKESLTNAPDLTKKLKEYRFNYDKLLEVLKSATNPGRWNLYERNDYTTDYIRNLINTDFGIYKESFVNTSSSLADLGSLKNMENFLNTEESGKKTILDTYPFTDEIWIQENLSNGISTNIEKAYKVNKTISLLSSKKTLSSFSDYDDPNSDKQLFSYFKWKILNPTIIEDNDTITTNINAANYYLNKTETKLLLTESFLDYGEKYLDNKNKLINKQTTSLINTPYFINAILEGNENKRNGVESPYVSLGYLYLNSLPLSTLSEKFKNNKETNVEELDYIFATLNNYSAIHRLPYVWLLKIGSIYHRYKKQKIDNVDILNNVWNNFDYVNSYDPITEDKNKSYIIRNYTGGTREIKLENTIGDNFIDLENGFYPKVINEIYYLFTGKEILQNYSQEEIDNLYYKNFKSGFSNKSFTMLLQGHDENNPNRAIRIKNWSSFFEIKNNADFTKNKQGKLLIIPSYGWVKFNQSKLEIWDSSNNKIVAPYIDNNGIYNGSVRSLWAPSNYGYFNNEWVSKPTPNQYFKTISNNNNNLQPFNLNEKNNYHSVEELFSVFTKEMLDVFENHFLNFCKSEDKFNPKIVNRGSTTFEDFLSSPEVKKQYPEGTIPYDDIFTLKQQFENQSSSFTYSSKENEFFNITQVMESIFFVDNIGLNEDIDQDLFNIKKTQINNFVNLHNEKFLNTKIILKIGNAGKYNRKVFNKFYDFSKTYIDSLGTRVSTDNFGFYVKNSLPTAENTTTLSESIVNYTEEWNALYLFVGEYEDEKMMYTNNGSYITDFFYDLNIEFTVNNISELHQIIKMYATSKKQIPTITPLEFYNSYVEYFDNKLEIQKNTLNDVFVKLNRQLPDINIEYDTSTESVLDGNVIKYEIWKELQWINDRWVAGQDFKNKTIFEEFLFLDEANRPLGDKIIVNIELLRQRLKGKPKDMSLYTLMGYIMDDNGFTFMPTPVYANFYGLNDRVRNAKPNENVTNEIAKDMFGTFMEVDVRDTRPKMVATYLSQYSKDLDFRDNKNIKRKNDAVDLTNPSDNTLIENLNNVEDFSKRNKVVGFNVEFGNQEQSMFKSISIDMNQFKNTAESNRQLVDIGNQYMGQPVIQQTVSLYNVYKTRSYTCNVTSIGNVMIQPTTYFILKHVPMFNGSYNILSVNHKITVDDFVTNFEGVRISKYALEKPDKLVASLNKKILKTFENKLLRSVASIGDNENESISNENNTELPENMCSEITQYSNIPFTSLSFTNVILDDFTNYVQNLSIDISFKKFIYCCANIENPFNGGSSTCANNNLFDIKSDKSWVSSFDNYITGQTCVTDNRTKVMRSYVSFDNFETSISFFKDYFNNYFPNYYDNFRNYSQGNDIDGNNYSEDRKTAETFYRMWYSFWIENFGIGVDDRELDNIFNIRVASDNTYKKEYYDLVEYFLNSLNQISSKFT